MHTQNGQSLSLATSRKQFHALRLSNAESQDIRIFMQNIFQIYSATNQIAAVSVLSSALANAPTAVGPASLTGQQLNTTDRRSVAWTFEPLLFVCDSLRAVRSCTASNLLRLCGVHNEGRGLQSPWLGASVFNLSGICRAAHLLLLVKR